MLRRTRLMDVNSFLLILSILCLGISIYVFYKYSLTLSDALFSFGLSMGTIGIAIFCGYLNILHLGGLTINIGWESYACTGHALYFLFLGCIGTSSEQMILLKCLQFI